MIDWAIRIASVVVLGTLGLTLLVFACIMGTDSGTASAMATSATLLVGGVGVLFALILSAIYPRWIEKYVPRHALIAKVLVRIPSYIIGTLGLAMFLYMFWAESIAPLLS